MEQWDEDRHTHLAAKRKKAKKLTKIFDAEAGSQTNLFQKGYIKKDQQFGTQKCYQEGSCIHKTPPIICWCSTDIPA
jgi:hypothetical protein